MVVIDERPLKKQKSRATSEMHDFLKFPATGDDEFTGVFRSNMNGFLKKHARPPPPCSLFPNLLIWQILFRIGELIGGTESAQEAVTLDIVEEDVRASKSVYCDQCRVIGWSGHPVCRKRYHFIIPRDCSSIQRQQIPCPHCGDMLNFSDPRCRKCNFMVSGNHLESWIRFRLEDTTHLLHGVVHSNGYGHLLRVNGREGGSEFLSGCDIMGFWDRICRMLRVRKISVMDVSKKYGLEYRLLHAVIKGNPWYGEWGYEFGTGSFAVDRKDYLNAVDNLSRIPLSIFFQARTPRTRLQDVITFYQSLSDYDLTTTRDLFSFLMELVRTVREQSRTGHKKSLGSSSWLCSWTKDDITRVEQSMIKVLRAVGGGRWVSWRALKGAVRGVASPELVDHCLKEIGGKPVDDMVVLSRCNSELDSIEYRLVSNVSSGNSTASATGISTMIYPNRPTKEHILRDIKYLYDALLNPYTMINYRPKTTRQNAASMATRLLDCKQFVKAYSHDAVVNPNPFRLQLSCMVELLGHPANYTAPPPELVILPVNATIIDLSKEITKAFREMYIFYESFEVEELLGYEEVKRTCQLKCLVGSTAEVIIQGTVLAVKELEQFRMERGTETWIVNCPCGATDDDGERMLACDKCSVWLHTRCSGINDFDLVPDMFVCWRCKRTVKTTPQMEQCRTKTTSRPLYKHPEASRKVQRGFGKPSAKHHGTKKGGAAKVLPKQSVPRGGVKYGKPSGKLSNAAETGKCKKEMGFEDSVVTCSFDASSVKKSDSNESWFRVPASGSASFDEDKKDAVLFDDSKVDSAGSATGSECVDDSGSLNGGGKKDVLSVIDTCTSPSVKSSLVKHSESGWKCKDEPIVDVSGSGLALRFPVR